MRSDILQAATRALQNGGADFRMPLRRTLLCVPGSRSFAGVCQSPSFTRAARLAGRRLPTQPHALLLGRVTHELVSGPPSFFAGFL